MKKENEVTFTTQHSFPGFIKSMVRKWPIFFIVGFVFAIGGYLYAKFQRPKFQSNLTFVIEQNSNAEIMGAFNLASQLGINLGNGNNNIFSGDNIIEIIKSRRIVEGVLLAIDTFDTTPFTLIEYYNHRVFEGSNKEKEEVHFPVGISRKSLNSAQDSILYVTYQNFVRNSLEVDRPDQMLSIYSIRVKTPNEKFTKIFTDKLIEATDSFYTDISSKKERRILKILEERVGRMKSQLSSSLSNKAASQDANLNPAFQEALIPLQKQQMNIQVFGAAYAELFKNLEIARFQYLNKIPLLQIIDSAYYPMKEVQPRKLKTTVMFGMAGVFLTFLLLWLIRLYRDIR